MFVCYALAWIVAGHAALEHYTHTKSVVVPLPKMKGWQIM